MKNFTLSNKLSLKFAFSIVALLVLASAAPAQIKLRNALDYDGDAKTDLAVVRKNGASLDWYVLQSLTGQLRSVNFGVTETDSLVQNDYDGDGKTDVAVWRENAGTFYVLKSTDSTLLTMVWGFTTDIPIAAYDAH